MPRKVTDVMQTKSLVCLSPKDTVLHAVQLMMSHRASAVVVLEAGTIVGIVTERDITLKLVAGCCDPRSTTLGDIMTRAPDTLAPTARTREALRLMHENHYRHLPVEQDGKIIGMIEITDLFAEVHHELEDEVHECQSYISGSDYSITLPAEQSLLTRE